MDELDKIKDRLVVVDKNVYDKHREIFNYYKSNEIFILEASEENKTMDTVLDICKKLSRLNAKRDANLISFGGGTIQGLTGFAANIFYRGINWYYIPTTLSAQADSCIGSKTSINFQKEKNMIGTFYPPNKVYIFPRFLKTLGTDEFLSGIGDVVKFNIMSDLSCISKLENDIDSLISHDYNLLLDYIRFSLEYKKLFVENDEFDYSEGKLINYANDFGYAIENISAYSFPCGQAASIGMIIANRISYKRGLLSRETCERIENVIKKIISMPLKEKYFKYESIKKYLNSRIVILNKKAEPELVADISVDEIKAALDQTRNVLLDKIK
jgi:3-dehydroquinate synthase